MSCRGGGARGALSFLGPLLPMVFILTLITILLSGCAGYRDLYRENSFFVHKDGYPIDANEKRLGPEEFGKQHVEKIFQGIEKYLEQVPSGNEGKILIFVHGGLNPYGSSLERMEEVIKAQKEQDERGKPKHPRLSSYYLIFLNWNSDWGSSVADDVLLVRRGERVTDEGALSTVGGMLTFPFVGLLRVGTAVVGVPTAWWALWETAGDSFRRADVGGDLCDLHNRRNSKLDAGSIATYVLASPVRLLGAPFIQAFGRPAWDNMKRRAELTFALEREVTRSAGAGALFMRDLKDRIQKWKSRNWNVEITLVGHSMGALVLNQLLPVFGDIYFHRIVYLAAAARMHDVETAVFPYLRRHQAAQFWSFSLSEADETRESGYVERGTLLVWIDSLLERIDRPAHRTWGRHKNLREHFQRSPEFPQGQVFFVKFDGRDEDGKKDPKKHGEFDHPEILERMLEFVEMRLCPPIGALGP